jgi:hypothetical protein
MKIIALLLVFAAGCNSRVPERIDPGDVIDAQTAETETAAAIAEWNTALPALHLSLGTPGDWTVIAGDAEGHDAYAEPYAPVIVVENPSVAVIIHEIGHALGFRGHLQTGIFASPIQGACIDQAALEALCRQRQALCSEGAVTTC